MNLLLLYFRNRHGNLRHSSVRVLVLQHHHCLGRLLPVLLVPEPGAMGHVQQHVEYGQVHDVRGPRHVVQQ